LQREAKKAETVESGKGMLAGAVGSKKSEVYKIPAGSGKGECGRTTPQIPHVSDNS